MHVIIIFALPDEFHYFHGMSPKHFFCRIEKHFYTKSLFNPRSLEGGGVGGGGRGVKLNPFLLEFLALNFLLHDQLQISLVQLFFVR